MTPMQLGTSAETEILKNAFITGVFMGAAYGVFAAARRLIPCRAAGFLCDLVYSLLFGGVYFLFTLSQTGYYRGFVLLSMLAGAVLWHASAGRLLVGISCAAAERVTHTIVVGINKICRFLKVRFVKVHTNFRSDKKMPEST